MMDTFQIMFSSVTLLWILISQAEMILAGWENKDYKTQKATKAYKVLNNSRIVSTHICFKVNVIDDE